MLFVVVVVYAFHIDTPFKTVNLNVVSNATNLYCSLIHCDFCNFLFYCEVDVSFLKLQTRHSLKIKKKNSLNQLQIQMKLLLEFINSQGPVSEQIIIKLLWSLLATKAH